MNKLLSMVTRSFDINKSYVLRDTESFEICGGCEAPATQACEEPQQPGGETNRYWKKVGD